MGKFSIMVSLQCALVILLIAEANGETTKTICNVKISELAECLPAITGEAPPPPTEACCHAMQKADLHCLCNYKSELSKFGVKPATAMGMLKKCGLRVPKECEAKV